MAANVGGLRIEPPRVSLERELARRIYARKSRLDSSVLDALVAQPKRYMDLQHLARNDKLLNDALRRLVEEGLVHQRRDPAKGRRARWYELSSLGVAVRDALVEYRLIDRLASESRSETRVEA